MQKLILYFFCFLMMAMPFEVTAKETLSASSPPEYAPFSYRAGGEIIGITPEIANEVFRRLHKTSETLYVGGWGHTLKLAKEGSIDVITGCFKTPEREQFLDFSIPYLKDKTVIFVRKDNMIKFNEWSDLKGMNGIALEGDSMGKEFDKYMQENLDVGRVETMEQGFYDLIIGASDYFVCGLYAGMYTINKEGLKNRIRQQDKIISEEDLYLAISKKSKYHELMPQVNEVLKQMIEEKYIQKKTDAILQSEI